MNSNACNIAGKVGWRTPLLSLSSIRICQFPQVINPLPITTRTFESSSGGAATILTIFLHRHNSVSVCLHLGFEVLHDILTKNIANAQPVQTVHHMSARLSKLLIIVELLHISVSVSGRYSVIPLIKLNLLGLFLG